MDQPPQRIPYDLSVELLFTDSSKNISDLKSRQWTTATVTVVAITALAALASGPKPAIPQVRATVVMFLVIVCHVVTIWKCHSNLHDFRDRLASLIDSRFSAEVQGLFTKGCKNAVADEGRIESILLASAPIALIAIWPW